MLLFLSPGVYFLLPGVYFFCYRVLLFCYQVFIYFAKHQKGSEEDDSFDAPLQRDLVVGGATPYPGSSPLTTTQPQQSYGK